MPLRCMAERTCTSTAMKMQTPSSSVQAVAHAGMIGKNEKILQKTFEQRFYFEA